MGLIARQPSAPIADGDTGSAPEIEGELTSLFNVLNGNLDNSNFASDADLAGTQFASASIPGTKIQNLGLAVGKFTASTVTTTQMARAAAPKAYVSTYTFPAQTEVTIASAFTDVPGLGTISVGDVTVGDQVRATFTGSVSGQSAAFSNSIGFALSINGTDTGTLVSWDILASNDIVNSPLKGSFRVSWQFTAPASTFNVAARYIMSSIDTYDVYWDAAPVVLSVLSIPAK